MQDTKNYSYRELLKLDDDTLQQMFVENLMQELNRDPPDMSKQSQREIDIRNKYEQKIAWYNKEIEKRTKEGKGLIESALKEERFDMDAFIRKAERIAIDIENHNTIINMLSKQYQQWFGEAPKTIDFSKIEIL